MRAEVCIFESNAPGLKANFYEPYVDKPSAVCLGILQLHLLHFFFKQKIDHEYILG